MVDDEYRRFMNRLNRKQHTFMLNCLNKIKKQETFYELVVGESGTGKSNLIKAIDQCVERYLRKKDEQREPEKETETEKEFTRKKEHTNRECTEQQEEKETLAERAKHRRKETQTDSAQQGKLTRSKWQQERD